jgi:F-box/leucine-rich repeat protein 2/20
VILGLQVADEVDDGAIVRLAASHPELQMLVLMSAAGAGEAGLKALAELKSLEMLALTGAARVSDGDLSALADGAPALRELGMLGSAVTPEGVKAFRLKRADVRVMTEIPEETRARLQAARSQPAIPPALSLRIPPEADDIRFRELLAGRTGWRAVDIQADAPDGWMEELARLPDLESVYLAGQPMDRLTARGIERLAACPRLRRLGAHPTRHYLDDDAVLAFARGCPELEEFWVGAQIGAGTPGPISEAALSELARGCPKLRQILLHIAPSVGDAALAVIGQNLPELGLLSLMGPGSATDAGLAALAACANLYSIHLDTSPEAGDAGLLALAEGCPKITDCWIGGGRGFTDAGLAAIAEAWPKIRRLELRDAGQITDDGLRALEKLAELSYLGLWNAKRLTDEGLDLLAGMPIERVTLTHVEFSAEAIARYQAKKPRGELNTQGAFNRIKTEGPARIR